jgi:DNA-nicking Smr family endonuclease
VSEKDSATMPWGVRSRRGRRRLTDEEERLWSVVARTVKPLRSGKRVPLAILPETPVPSARPAKKSEEHPLPAAAPVRHAKPPSAIIAIARRERQQLARGKAELGGRIDLHGLTQAEAHDALLRFLRRTQAEGAKFVLVITGKGGFGAGERGVLRRQVPLWLGLPEFRVCVLGFDVAHVGHGGEGALYVRLRRAR